ncbi:MAG: TIGR02587 family membrane protein [Alphaproteobacteria bacterium]
MTQVCDGIEKECHPEERPLRDAACGGSSGQAGASRRTHGALPTTLSHYLPSTGLDRRGDSTAVFHSGGTERRRRAAAGIQTKLGCHSFRATKNGGLLDHAQQMAAYKSACTTKLYDRRNDKVMLGEARKIILQMGDRRRTGFASPRAFSSGSNELRTGSFDNPMPEISGAQYARDLARAFGGAIIFGFPLLMTMEMWWLGFYMNRFRLALFMALTLPVLLGLSYFAGFRRTFLWRENIMDALAAFGVGFVASAIMLAIFGILRSDMPLSEIVGKIGVQTVPASIGAILASKQMGSGGGEGEDSNEDENKARASYGGELFLMAAGAIFVAFNVAPTEEMILIAYRMTPWHALALILCSMLMLHAFVYTVGFAGQEEPPGNTGLWRTFLHFTVAGYGIALLVGLYVLWTFGRTDDVQLTEIAMIVIVLGFPAALGAALARLVV